MNENIKVFLRIKPNVENISYLKDEECASYEINNNNRLLLYEQKKSCKEKKEMKEMKEMKTKTFSFNHIFDINVKQNEIFELVGKTLVDNFINGYNSSIMAYGNTNSGKTYTLYGDRTNSNEKENKGLIYYCLSYFFNLYKKQKDIDLCVSVVEIYLEKIRDLGKIFELCHKENNDFDLLNFYSNFRESIIREDRQGNTYVENVTLLPVKNIEDVLNIIDLCFKYRRTSATKKNLMSSRSHCLLTVYQYKHYKERQFVSQINFIDLAGSEKFTDVEMVNKKELININNTLSVLNRVIIALSTKNKIDKNFENKRKQETNRIDLTKIHVPYRDSKLTRLLKNSLDGNSFTYILICLNIHCYRIDDFINSLIFAKRCKTITKVVKKNNMENASTNSNNSVCSSSDTSSTSYESCDSICSNLQFLLHRNKRDKYSFDNEEGFYKKKIKTKKDNQKNDQLNKLAHIFFSIMKNKSQKLTKLKNSVISNIVKIVKAEEKNKEELKKNKDYFLKILRKKKKELNKNEKLLIKIINTKGKKKDTNIKQVTDIFISETDTNTDTNTDTDTDTNTDTNTDNDTYTNTDVQNKNKNKSKNKNETKDSTKNIQKNNEGIEVYKNTTSNLHIQQTCQTDLCIDNSYNIKMNNEINNEKIRNMYNDVEKVLQMETQKLNQKIHIIDELIVLNKSLFINIRKLTNILRNIYQNKYKLIIKNGKKQLHISSYIYEDIQKLYQKKLVNSVPNNIPELTLLENINKNTRTIYETIKQNESFYEFQKEKF